MTHDPVELGREVIAACRALGFALAGITSAERTSREAELRGWLAAGKHGAMDWMEELLEERLDPRRMLPGARSIVMAGDVYSAGASASRPMTPGMARVARYAQGRDYHVIIKRRLHRLADQLRSRYPGHEFRSFVDTGPVLEREHAARAGLGWIGKHTLLINPQLGSYVLLGGMMTTLELAAPPSPSPPSFEPHSPLGVIGDSCGTCTRCIDACPTKAITAYSVDARKCISYLTIEHAGDVAPELRARMGDWLFGCDVCQEVCPFNRGLDEGHVHRAYRGAAGARSIVDVLGWGRAEHESAVRGSAMKRATLGMLKRNALIAAANGAISQKNEEIVKISRRVMLDEGESPEARGAARDALQRLEEGDMAWKKPCSEGTGAPDAQKSS